MKRQHGRLAIVMLAAALAAAACASKSAPPATTATGPRFPEYPPPDIPATLTVPDDVRARHQAAWQALQAGNTRRAASEFTAIVRRLPAFYPAHTGLGFARLASRQYREAEPSFATAIAANSRYVPAWVGRSEALIGLGRTEDAIEALQRVVALDPERESARTRLELLRFRLTQSLIEGARRARSAGRLDEAERQLEAALSRSPESTAILSELVRVEVSASRLDEAEAHARRAVQLEPREGEWHAVLGDVLEAQRKYRDAAAAYSRAVAIEPKPEWRARAVDLREKAEAALLPATFAKLATAPTVSRGEVAAYVGIHLDDVVASAPRRITEVATDVRTHWAATWILPVTRAGIMSIYANHTFQPNANVRRADLASIAASLIRIAGAGRRADLARWQAARPKIADLSTSHVSYASAALAVSAGAMSLDADGRFQPTTPATGQDLEAMVQRVNVIGTPAN